MKDIGKLEEDFKVGEIAFYYELGNFYKVKVLEADHKSWGKSASIYRVKILKAFKGHPMRGTSGKINQEFCCGVGKSEILRWDEQEKMHIFKPPLLTHYYDKAFYLSNLYYGRAAEET